MLQQLINKTINELFLRCKFARASVFNQLPNDFTHFFYRISQSLEFSLTEHVIHFLNTKLRKVFKYQPKTAEAKSRTSPQGRKPSHQFQY